MNTADEVRPLTKREHTLRVFRGEPTPHVFFQPRLEPWHDRCRRLGTLPADLDDLNVQEMYDALDLSMRYMHYYTGQPDPVEVRYADAVKVTERFDTAAGEGWRVFDTPHALRCGYRWVEDSVWWLHDYPVTRTDDLRKLGWLFEHTTYHFNREHFATGDRYLGDRGVPQFFMPKSPYQQMCQCWMRLETLVYALVDDPALVEVVMARIDASYDSLYEEILASGLPEIINFGENIHAQLLTPQYFERYFVPFYQKRVGQLRRSGIFTHVHIDGDYEPLLRYFADLPFDGIEALTPQPQGDCTLEETKAHLGDKVLLDGIPAVLFMSSHPREQLQACVERLVKLFHPRLVLGISDELPQAADEEGLARLEWCRDYCASRK